MERVIVNETGVQGSQDQGQPATNSQKKLIKLGFHSDVVSQLPEGHLMRQKNTVWFPVSPARKTVGELMKRVKEELEIPCDMHLTMRGGVFMPKYPTEHLPSVSPLRMDRDYRAGQKVTSPAASGQSPQSNLEHESDDETEVSGKSNNYNSRY